MAFITYNRGVLNDPSSSIGLTVAQWVDDENSDQFFEALATFTSLEADAMRREFKRKAPYSTLYQDMVEMVLDIDAWFHTRHADFTKMKAALTASYNPIENYRRTRSGYESKINGSIEDVGTNNTSNGDSTTENEVAPYDSATYNKESKSHTTYSEDVDTSNTKTYTDLQTDVNVTDAGNVGVTTNQQMINEELQLRINNSLLYLIIKEFVKEFCIPLYN